MAINRNGVARRGISAPRAEEKANADAACPEGNEWDSGMRTLWVRLESVRWGRPLSTGLTARLLTAEVAPTAASATNADRRWSLPKRLTTPAVTSQRRE